MQSSSMAEAKIKTADVCRLALTALALPSVFSGFLFCVCLGFDLFFVAGITESFLSANIYTLKTGM
jgi:ABC-type spermidine/putrescine transport system permease subunit II